MTNQWRAFIDFSTGGSLGDWLMHNIVYVEGKNQWLWPLRAHSYSSFQHEAPCRQ